MGHANLTMTQRYAHLSPEFQKAEVDRLNGVFKIEQKFDDENNGCREGLNMVTANKLLNYRRNSRMKKSKLTKEEKAVKRKAVQEAVKKYAEECPCISCIIKGNCSNLLKTPGEGIHGWHFNPQTTGTCEPVWKYFGHFEDEQFKIGLKEHARTTFNRMMKAIRGAWNR